MSNITTHFDVCFAPESRAKGFSKRQLSSSTALTLRIRNFYMLANLPDEPKQGKKVREMNAMQAVSCACA